MELVHSTIQSSEFSICIDKGIHVFNRLKAMWIGWTLTTKLLLVVFHYSGLALLVNKPPTRT